MAISGAVAHDAAMPRRFRFRVREGHQIHSYDAERTTTHGAGHEFVLSEKDAARLLRDRGNRDAFDLVEVVVENEAATPPAEQPSRD